MTAWQRHVEPPRTKYRDGHMSYPGVHTDRERALARSLCARPRGRVAALAPPSGRTPPRRGPIETGRYAACLIGRRSTMRREWPNAGPCTIRVSSGSARLRERGTAHRRRGPRSRRPARRSAGCDDSGCSVRTGPRGRPMLRRSNASSRSGVSPAMIVWGIMSSMALVSTARAPFLRRVRPGPGNGRETSSRLIRFFNLTRANIKPVVPGSVHALSS